MVVPSFRDLVINLENTHNWTTIGVTVDGDALVLGPSHGALVQIVPNFDLNVGKVSMSLCQEVDLAIQVSLHGQNEFVRECVLWLQ